MSAPMSVSGQFSRAGVDDESPSPDLLKITEGFAAVLFPPSKQKGSIVGTVSAPTSEKKQTTAEAEKDGNCSNFFSDSAFAGEDDQAVFYNPAQVVNRDLTICVMETFSRQRKTEPLRKGGVGDRGITIVEALSASGLRSVRYWKEITGLKYIIANDLDPDAVECMKRNLQFNQIPIGGATFTGNTPSQEWRGVVPNEDDAIVLMQRLGLEPAAKLRTVGIKVTPPVNVALGDRPTLLGADAAGASSSSTPTDVQPQLVPLLQCEKMDIVDLDPYGTASPFLDPAMQCVKEGGLMCITSTDSAILCGTYPETAHAKYNSMAIRHSACHEMAVRILLAAVERTANKHKKYIVPLLSLHIDFYVRVFVRVYTQQAEVKLAACKLAHYFKCTRCPNFSVVPLGRVKVHGKNNGNSAITETSDAAEQPRGGKKVNKKERRAAEKRAREEGSNNNTMTASENASSTQEAQATADAANPAIAPAFHNLNRMAPNAYPPNHDRSVPFSVNPTTIRNISYECCVCHGAMAIAGPIYAAPIHNHEFLETLDKTIVERHSEKRLTATNRIRGLVAAAKDELPLSPMFVELPEIASLVRVRCPPLPEFVAALSRLGYKASQVHCNHNGLKTDAPVDVLVGLMIDYRDRFGANAEAAELQEGTTATPAVATEDTGRKVYVPSITGDFTYSKDHDFKKNNAVGVVKFVQNAPGWGPKARHRGVAREDEEE